jgi:N-acetylmuramoyl-L-alanine amidase
MMTRHFACALVLLCLGTLNSCGPKADSPPPSPSPTLPKVAAPNLAPLGKTPDWSDLQAYDGTISRADFERLLTTVYALPESTLTTLTVHPDRVQIRKQSHLPLTEPNGTFDLKFGSNPKPLLRYWRTRSEIPPSPDPARPLEGVRIALDPGHIGGTWSKLEERHFQPETDPPVCEGTLTLIVAKLLRPMLESLGATVSLVRSATEPVTSERPENFIAPARQELIRLGVDPDNPPEKRPMQTVRWQSEKLFYRTAEIRARAKLVNESLRPDLVVCLHFNAGGTSWGKPGVPNYVPENHLHLLVNGAYSLDELTHDDERHEMLTRLLSGAHEEERALAEMVAGGLIEVTGLPPFTYRGGAMPVPGQPYLWARNLLANRLYQCPVVYCEPFIMNHQTTAHRLQRGDYEGVEEIDGISYPSIFRQYAQGVMIGLQRYYGAKR